MGNDDVILTVLLYRCYVPEGAMQLAVSDRSVTNNGLTIMETEV